MGVLGNKKLAPGGASAVRHSNRKVCEREREGEAGRKVGGGRMRRGMDGRVASDWRGPWRVCACLRLFAIACVVLCARTRRASPVFVALLPTNSRSVTHAHAPTHTPNDPQRDWARMSFITCTCTRTHTHTHTSMHALPQAQTLYHPLLLSLHVSPRPSLSLPLHLSAPLFPCLLWSRSTASS